MSKIEGLERRADKMSHGGKTFKDGYEQAFNECSRILDSLPYIFKESISEYWKSIDFKEQPANTSAYPKTRDECIKAWQAMLKDTIRREDAMRGFNANPDNSVFECPDCGMRYYSVLMMAFHQFKAHVIETRNGQPVRKH